MEEKPKHVHHKAMEGLYDVRCVVMAAAAYQLTRKRSAETPQADKRIVAVKELKIALQGARRSNCAAAPCGVHAALGRRARFAVGRKPLLPSKSDDESYAATQPCNFP